MPQLSQIELYLDGSFEKSRSREFVMGSRTLCGFIERSIKGQTVEAPFKRLNVFCSRNPGREQVTLLHDRSTAELHIVQDVFPASDLEPVQRHEQYIRVLELGLERARSEWGVSSTKIEAAIDGFRDGGYRFCWLQDEGTWSKQDLASRVFAEVALDEFTLEQEVSVGCQPVLRRQIAVCAPREALYFRFLGKLSRVQSGDLVYRARGKTLSKFLLSSGTFEEASGS